jgi:hypothetical protein
MASFGSSMPIAREGTTIPGACHLGVLSVVEEEGASPGPVQTAGSMEKCQRCRFRDLVILRGAARACRHRISTYKPINTEKMAPQILFDARGRRE